MACNTLPYKIAAARDAHLTGVTVLLMAPDPRFRTAAALAGLLICLDRQF